MEKLPFNKYHPLMNSKNYTNESQRIVSCASNRDRTPAVAQVSWSIELDVAGSCLKKCFASPTKNSAQSEDKKKPRQLQSFSHYTQTQKSKPSKQYLEMLIRFLKNLQVAEYSSLKQETLRIVTITMICCT